MGHDDDDRLGVLAQLPSLEKMLFQMPLNRLAAENAKPLADIIHRSGRANLDSLLRKISADQGGPVNEETEVHRGIQAEGSARSPCESTRRCVRLRARHGVHTEPGEQVEGGGTRRASGGVRPPRGECEPTVRRSGWSRRLYARIGELTVERDFFFAGFETLGRAREGEADPRRREHDAVTEVPT